MVTPLSPPAARSYGHPLTYDSWGDDHDQPVHRPEQHPVPRTAHAAARQAGTPLGPEALRTARARAGPVPRCRYRRRRGGETTADAKPASAAPQPTVTVTATTTATVTATPLAKEPEPAPTVTATKTVKVTTTVTAQPAGDGGSDDGGSGGSQDVYYGNCGEVRAAGAAPIHRGEPGYASHLDRDKDGVACDT